MAEHALAEVLSDLISVEEDKTRVLVENDYRALEKLLERESTLVRLLANADPDAGGNEEVFANRWEELSALRERNRSLLNLALTFTEYSLQLLIGSPESPTYNPRGSSTSPVSHGARVNRKV